MGKTLADTVLGYIVPLIFYHFKFEFVDKEMAKTENKPGMQILTKETANIQLKIHTLRQVPL